MVAHTIGPTIGPAGCHATPDHLREPPALQRVHRARRLSRAGSGLSFFCCDPGRGHLPIQVDRTARAIIERAVDAFVAQQPHSTDVQSYAYTVEEEDQTLTRLNGLRDQSEAYHEGTPK